jgi:hypothetical protein
MPLKDLSLNREKVACPLFKRARLYKTHPSSPTQTDESLALLYSKD